MEKCGIYHHFSLIITTSKTSVPTLYKLLKSEYTSISTCFRYFQLLAWGDLVLCLAYLPITVSTNGCILYQYWFAWYFAHLGWSVPFGLHAFCTYILTWLALDRCLAVWWHKAFTTIQQPHLQQWRALGTAAFCIIIHIPLVVEAEVACSTWGLVHYDPHCDNGTWLTFDVFHDDGPSHTHVIFIRLVAWKIISL